MKRFLLLLVGVGLLLIAGCGNEELNEPIVLKNQDDTEVIFPSKKPVVFFFMTTYT